MCVCVQHRNLETRKTRKTRNEFSVQVRNFLLPLSFRNKESEAQSFNCGFFISPPPSCTTPAQGLREQGKVNRLVRCPVLNSTNFLQIPKILRTLPVRDIIRTC